MANTAVRALRRSARSARRTLPALAAALLVAALAGSTMLGVLGR